jgi:hypothetical protein
VSPGPQPAAGRRGGTGTRTVAHASGVGPAGALPAHDGPGELLALQQTAGNRAVAGLMGLPVVQRHPGPTTNADVDEAPGAGPVEATAAPTEAEETEEEETSQPGTGTTGTTGSTLKGDARRKAIEDTCRASDTGTWAMSIIEKWKIPVDYEFGGEGSYHQGGRIYINKTLGIGGAALTLMHEAQHADTFKSGKQADRETLGRDEYIKQSIADEAEAVVRQIEGMAVTSRLGVDMAGAGVNEGLKQRYLTAFYAKRDELKKSNPDMSTGEINRICRQTTRDGEVTKWFHDGTFVTSTKHNNYAVYYGDQWDEVHKKPGKK